jgi:hypothetical protein
MESKYAGKCSVCETPWKVGEQIHYSKDPKIICTNMECFKEQGGSISEYNPQQTFGGSSKGGSSYKSNYPVPRTLEQKLSDMVVLDTQIAKLATDRLKVVEQNIGTLETSEKLIFLESWARTIATSFNQR